MALATLPPTPTNGRTRTPPARSHQRHPNENSSSIALDSPQGFRFLSRMVAADLARSAYTGGGGQGGGLSFDTNYAEMVGWARDYYKALGWHRSLTYPDYHKLYRRGGIAKVAVDIMPSHVWRGDIKVVEDPRPDFTTPWEAAINGLFKRLKAKNVLMRADKLSRIGSYSGVLIGIAGNEGHTLEDEPTPTTFDQIVRLQPLSEAHCKIGKLDEDLNSPRHGYPLFYDIILDDRTNKTEKCHWKRVLHIAQDNLESDLYGMSIFEAIFNYFDDLTKCHGGGAEAAWKHMDRGLHADIDPEKVTLTPDDEDDLNEQFADFVHGYENILATRGVTLKDFGTSTPNFGPNVNTLLRLIAATIRVPLRILVGSERGELASAQDRNNFNDSKTSYREQHAEPNIIGGLLDRLDELKFNTSGGWFVTPDEWYVDWGEKDESTNEERANISGRIAKANKDLADADMEPLASTEEIRDKVWGWSSDPLSGEVPGTSGLRGLRGLWGLRVGDSITVLASLHDAVDHHLEPLAQLVLNSWADGAIVVSDNTTLGEIEAVGLAAFERADDYLANVLPAKLLDVMNDAALHELAGANKRDSFLTTASNTSFWVNGDPVSLPGMSMRLAVVDKVDKDIGFRASDFGFTFNTANPHAVEWAQLRAGALITGMATDSAGQGQLETIRLLVSSSLDGGLTHAQLVDRIQGSIGLRYDQVESGGKFVRNLMEASPGSTISSGNYSMVVPPGGVTNELVAHHLTQLTEHQLRTRAVLIARSEINRAAVEGQHELWRQAVADGHLDPLKVQRVYLHNTERHIDRSGSTTPIGTNFLVEPGEEPNCGCTSGLVRI